MEIRSLAALAASLFIGCPALADMTEQLIVADGLEARVWAESPQLFNPTNIDIDARGRIWVAEAVNYRETLKPLHAKTHPQGDRVMILEDTDGDGVCDSSKVFVQDIDLFAPLGIAVLGNKVIVSCSPHLIVYTDIDGNDKADTKQILLTGFGGFDIDHGLHAVTGFLDGRWYFNVGNQGPQEVTDAGGWTLRSGSYVTMRGPNSGNRKSDDGRVWTGGLALRVDPDGKHLTPLAHNFRNCYEIAIDSFGNMFQSDNDDDGNQSCRLSWMMEGANMGYASADGTRSWKTDWRPGQTTQTAHWHQDDPGVLSSGDITGAGGPTGVVVYEGGLLPEKYIGCVLNADAGRNVVRAHRPIANGAGFRFERSDLIAARGDAGKWFRPSDVAIGTDGAVYIADWYDPIVGGHDMKDKQGGGRILRVAPRGDNTQSPKLDLATLDGQLATLNSPAGNVRYLAAERLTRAGDLALLERLPQFRTQPLASRARLIWVLARSGEVGIATVEGLLDSPDEIIRLTAFRALRAVDRHLPVIVKLVGDESPALRREAAIALRDVPTDKCSDFLELLAERNDGNDRFYLEAVGIACEGREDAIFRAVVKRAEASDPLKWPPKIANLAWRLHPISALEALAKRAASAACPLMARKQAIDAIAFIRDERAAEAMQSLTQSDTEDVKALATWWLKNRADNDWKDFPAAKRFIVAAAESDERAAERVARGRGVVLDAKASRKERERAVAALAETHDGALALVELAAEQQLPKELQNTTADALHRNPDLGIRALASQYFPRKAASGEALPSVTQLAAMKGDAARGREVFFSPIAGCSKCHGFAGEGRDVGPDLTSIRTKYARPELLDAILNPSANIAFGYEAWIIKTKDNQVYAGFILAEGKQIVIKESSGEQRKIFAKEIVLRKKQAFSIMPDNVALGLTAQQLADLAEFLLTTPAKP